MSNGVAKAQLLAVIERIERLSEEKTDIAEQIREVFAEAKGNGFDAGVIRALLKRRAADPQETAEREELLALYAAAIGMDLQPRLDLGDLAAALKGPRAREAAAGLAEAAGARQ